MQFMATCSKPCPPPLPPCRSHTVSRQGASTVAAAPGLGWRVRRPAQHRHSSGHAGEAADQPQGGTPAASSCVLASFMHHRRAPAPAPGLRRRSQHAAGSAAPLPRVSTGEARPEPVHAELQCRRGQGLTRLSGWGRDGAWHHRFHGSKQLGKHDLRKRAVVRPLLARAAVVVHGLFEGACGATRCARAPPASPPSGVPSSPRLPADHPCLSHMCCSWTSAAMATPSRTLCWS
jgi:hypothetical protein